MRVSHWQLLACRLPFNDSSARECVLYQHKCCNRMPVPFGPVLMTWLSMTASLILTALAPSSNSLTAHPVRLLPETTERLQPDPAALLGRLLPDATTLLSSASAVAAARGYVCSFWRAADLQSATHGAQLGSSVMTECHEQLTQQPLAGLTAALLTAYGRGEMSALPYPT